MAVGSHGTKSESGADFVASGAQFVEYEAFIEAQLRKTRSHVRGVDIAAATMVLLAGTVGYFFVAVLIDHWLVSGGLGFWGRAILLVLYLAVAGWWTIAQIMPLLLRRINPLYAAQTIEHSRPTLKNALVNFLLFRSDPQAVHQRVFEQIEQQAATSLVGVEVESTVDRSRLVTIGYVLVALVALGAIYALVSPKSPFKTVSRVFMPWADIAPPTSTVIDEIEPGSTQAFRGQQVTVKARVQGLPDDEQVLLYYTTADRQIVDRAVEMARPSGDYRHTAVLPAGDAALQQTITYRIEAGDAQSRDYEITVVAAPTIVVQAIEYKYPAYTGLLAQRLEHQGDLKAIEGTEVVLEGLANQPIAQAYVDFDANGSLDLTMRADGTTARTSFRLGMSEDRKKPEYELYQLLFKNAEGKQNPQPVRHRIEVVADLAPEIQFVEPTREEIEVPLDGSAGLELVASDPDFALAEVRLVVRHGEKPLRDEKLLNESWRGQFVKKLRFSPNDHKLAVGEVVEYYAVAVDNKTPRPNQTETSRRRIRITSPTGREGGDQLAQKNAGDEQGDGDRAQSQPGGDSDRPREEQAPAADQESQATEPGETSSPEDSAARNEREPVPADEPQDDPSDDQQDQPSDPRNESGNQRGDQKSADDRQDQAGERNEPQPSSAEQQAGDDSNSGESSDSGSQQGSKSDDKQSGEQQERGQSDKQPSGSEQGGDEQGASGQQQGGSAGQSGKEQGKQSSDQSGAGQSGKQESDNVASDGTNDGDAIERILKHRDQQDPNAGGEAGEKSAAQDRQNSERSAGDKADADKPQGEQQDEPSNGQPGQNSSASKQPGKQQGSQRGSGQEQGSKSDANHAAQQQEGGGNADDKQQSGQQQKDKAGDAKSTSGNQADKSKQGQPADTNEQSSDQQGASDAGERAGDQSGSKAGEKQQTERTPGEGQQGTENSAGKKDGGKQQDPGSPKGNQGQQGATRDNNTREDGSPQNADTKGQGGQSKDDPTRAPDQQPQQSSEQRPDAKGGDGQQEKGESGAGKKSDDNAGSPSPQESNQPREKSQQPGSENSQEKPEGDEQSPSTSKRESDSSGESDGDRSGGGEKGGGQKANQSGTGGAGQNTAADEGAGQSDEAGDGDTSDRAGGDRQSQNQTGQQGKQPGQGSDTKGGQGQEQAGGDQAPSQPTGEPSNDRKSGGEGGGTPGGEQGGADTPKGAGNSAPDKQWKPGVDRAADPNLEYTRKATDLAIDHLKNQLSDGRDDSELLKQLGWTREEADAFIQRWEAMRGQSQAAGPKGDAARRELDETLRSLGLRPRGSAIRSGGKADDRATGLQESRRTTPPPEYSEAFKAYTQGTSRGGK